MHALRELDACTEGAAMQSARTEGAAALSFVGGLWRAALPQQKVRRAQICAQAALHNIPQDPIGNPVSSHLER